ncbi:MAG: hypothetical protein KF744_09045 [Taibaiella sp.]|nr:hypothetical protein [Taibaiella sp.]
MATWQELDKQVFSITTGDGKVYKPNVLNPNYLVGYNVSQFNFRNVSGTLVRRNRPMGAVYGLEIIFQGAEHIRTATEFRKSAANPKPWVIQHPKYGRLVVQPIDGLFFDNNDKILNTTRITGPVMETIEESNLAPTENAADVVSAAKGRLDIGYAADYVNSVPAPSVQDVQDMGDDLNGFQKAIKTISTAGSEVINKYNDAAANINRIYNTVNDEIDTVIGRTARAIASVQSFMSLPATILDTLDRRMTYLINEFNFLMLQAGLIDLPTQKRLFQVNGGTCLGAMCVAATYNPGTAYDRSSGVVRVIQQLAGSYNQYIAALDVMQGPNGGEVDVYVPDAGTLNELTNLVYYTLSYLFEVAKQAKQKRTIVVMKDSNWISLAKELYGLLPDDSTITRLMEENNAGLNTLLQVDKGTKVVYYV